MKAARTLKGRALQLLAQREQSRVELRRKLLTYLKADEAKAADSPRPDPERLPPDQAQDASTRVEAVLDWLAARQFASDARFAESRVHARSARYGNLRIRQELKQHAVTLTPEAASALEASEASRAASVYRRRFDLAPETPTERAKRARFLAARGFSSEVIRQVLRDGGAGSDAGDDAS